MFPSTNLPAHARAQGFPRENQDVGMSSLPLSLAPQHCGAYSGLMHMDRVVKTDL